MQILGKCSANPRQVQILGNFAPRALHDLLHGLLHGLLHDHSTSLLHGLVSHIPLLLEPHFPARLSLPVVRDLPSAFALSRLLCGSLHRSPHVRQSHTESTFLRSTAFRISHLAHRTVGSLNFTRHAPRPLPPSHGTLHDLAALGTLHELQTFASCLSARSPHGRRFVAHELHISQRSISTAAYVSIHTVAPQLSGLSGL